MKYKIIYDGTNRLRVRFGKYAFNRFEAMGVQDYIKSFDFVQDSVVTASNGGVLIYYLDGSRGAIFDILNSLNKEKISSLSFEVDEDLIKLEKDFKRNVVVSVAQRLIMPIFMPMPLGRIITLIRSAKFFKEGLQSLSKLQLNVSVLDATSIAVAIATGDYSTANNVMLLLRISEMLEDYTMSSAKLELAKSLQVNVDFVWVLENGQLVKKSLSKINLGDIVVVNSGNLIPVDGTVLRSEAYVNESAMTGESMPVRKKEGSTVFAGSVVEEGNLEINVTGVNTQTRISKILSLIDTSQNLKADIQKNAQNIADGMVKYSLMSFFGIYALTRNITRAMSVLMVDYSCAIRLSTSISVIACIRQASEEKIVIKGGKFLEEFANANTIVFDKTGTLTHATPHLNKIITFDGFDENEALKIAACLEEHFPHSVARSIVKAAEERHIIHEETHAKVNYIVAHGLSSYYGEKRALIGSRHFLEDDEKICLTDEQKKVVEQECADYSTLYLSLDDKIIAIFCIDDPPRAEAKEVIGRLKNSGFKNIVMITGDNENVAKRVSEKLGITDFYANVLPDEKYSIVQEMKKSGQKVAMVGDGINDAPALSVADVSLAMKDSSDIAREVCDITLLSSDLNDLIELRILSKKLFDKVKKNYVQIAVFNSSLIAMGIGQLITPGVLSLLHNSSTVYFCINSSKKIPMKGNM